MYCIEYPKYRYGISTEDLALFKVQFFERAFKFSRFEKEIISYTPWVKNTILMNYIERPWKGKPPLLIMASPFLSHWAELENIRGDIRLPIQREKKGRLSIWTIQAGNCKYALELYWNQAFSESFDSGKDHANGYESTFDLRLIFLSLAWCFQGFIETVYRLFSLKFSVSLQKIKWIYEI